MATYNHTKILLGMEDLNIHLEQNDFEEECYFSVHQFKSSTKKMLSVSKAFKKVLTVTGTLKNPPKMCPHCRSSNNGAEDMIDYGSYRTVILIGQYNLQPAYLKLTKQRYLCKHCQKTTVSQTNLTKQHCTISSPLKVMILQELGKTKPIKDIAETWNVSSHTVLRQLKAYSYQYNTKPTSLPKHIAIDEFKSVKNVKAAMSCILMDNHKHIVVDVLENRTQAFLYDYFMRFSRAERLKVKTITMDMNGAFKDFLPSIFPNAIVVIDRFHIVQLVTRALNQHRIEVMNRIKSKNKPDANKFKRYWKLLLKDWNELAFEEYKKYSLFKQAIHERGIVDYLLSKDSTLSLSYRLIHEVMDAIKEHSYDQFIHVLEESKKYRLPRKIRTAFNTLYHYRHNIQNSLTYTLSNGCVEGTNNKIKVIKRISYGYRNFYHLRSRIILSTAHNKVKNEAYRPLLFTEEDAIKKYEEEYQKQLEMQNKIA